MAKSENLTSIEVPRTGLIKDLPVEWKELHKSAVTARERAYAPYSRFAVGSAVRTREGKVFSGCNIENASYWATMCAERVALYSCRAARAEDILSIAIVAHTKDPIPPCGLCRQVMTELAPQARVLLSNLKGAFTLCSVEELLPFQVQSHSVKNEP